MAQRGLRSGGHFSSTRTRAKSQAGWPRSSTPADTRRGPVLLLTIDLGSTVTKVVAWREDGPCGVGRSILTTEHRPGGIAEQSPAAWWESVVEATGRALEHSNGGSEVRGIVFSAARQTFCLVDAAGLPLTAGIMWSDRRAVDEAHSIALAATGAEAFRLRTGAILDSASPLAKLAWISRNQPDALRRARWLLFPRDLVVQRLTGSISTDRTLASASGLYDTTLSPVSDLGASAGLGDDWVRLLPPVLDSTEVSGQMTEEAASALGNGVRPGIPVVIGAGDRACEVLGTEATTACPMVSWGTTANVSVPVIAWPETAGLGVCVTRGAEGGFLIEAGLSSAGSFLDWLLRVGAEHDSIDALLERAGKSPPGSNGVVAVSWLGGARAPWWRDDARAAFLGLSPEHTIGDLARSAVESVAFEVGRCLEAVSGATGSRPERLAMAAGAAIPIWREILTSVTSLTANSRRTALSASAGAALLASHATGMRLELDAIDPPGSPIVPEPALVRTYESLRAASDLGLEAALGFSNRASGETGRGS